MINAIIGALVIGLCLSVFGSGGSILTIPVLLYMVGMSANMAIPSSLLIVGRIALFSSITFIRQGRVSWKHVLLFGVPGMLGTALGAWLASFVTSYIQLTVFVVLMLLSSVMMWRNTSAGLQSGTPNLPVTFFYGIVVGSVTGFVGVGGGFLIIPALVLLGGLTLHFAVGTSLLIIALQSSVGFAKYYTQLAPTGGSFDWQVIGVMIAGGILGGLAGGTLNQKLPKEKLQKGFALFLVAMAIFVIFRSLL